MTTDELAKDFWEAMMAYGDCLNRNVFRIEELKDSLRDHYLKIRGDRETADRAARASGTIMAIMVNGVEAYQGKNEITSKVKELMNKVRGGATK